MQHRTRNSLLLILTALIWGVAFVAQSKGGSAIGAYSFNFVRFLLGAAVLLPVIKLLDRLGLSGKRPVTHEDRISLWTGGTACGVMMCIASNLQQVGINLGTAAGKAGFLTTCYIILVPILGLFLKKKCSWNIWGGVVLTVAGLYLLCMSGSMSLRFSDVLVMFCALAFAVQILLVDHYAPLVDGVRLSCIQFLVCGILCGIPAFMVDMKHSFMEISNWAASFANTDAWIAILYAGICSCGIAYTLQIIGQQGVNPTVASLLMSLESVFSVLAGWIILNETLNIRELIGCGMIFGAIVLAQIPVRGKACNREEGRIAKKNGREQNYEL